ncbi:membrane hypothetical protein [Candidatus Desulfosporosinus infrequens]|uniref:Uncharacterized protein n=1 Tax=Candidatus Desulfosporosinus infrequens TaxID=2043169 RepID=A0A2U3LUY0_9FIRM|nr:membrane hypothetical protein [Candidatus Desulfosporosinus infrequens]
MLVGLIPVLIYGYVIIVFTIILFKKYQVNIPVKIIISISLVSQLIGLAFKIEFFNILRSICIELAICLAVFIEKEKFRIPIVIFVILFLIGQAIGYGFNIIPLKIYMTIDNGHGSSYSLASTFIPLALAFMINYMYTKIVKMCPN